MATKAGRFDWFELMTTDTVAAEAFYRGVIGWGTEKAPGAMDYTLFTAEAPAAGMMAMPADATGMPPFWHGYVTVTDLDATVAKAQSLGGTLIKPPMAMEGVGRFAPLADPQGAILAVAQWAGAVSATPETPHMAPLHFGWSELATTDWQAGLAYYSALFGWETFDSFDMGPMGIYQMFGQDGVPMGGMFNRPPQMPVSAWGYYVTVPDIDAVQARAEAAGAQVMNGPMEVPNDDWIVQFRDPQGAFFAIAGKRAK
jgi:uncharacterized protein